MKIGVLVPTRGDRKIFIEQCKNLISKQTVIPDEIYIVDFPPISNEKDITKRYRMGCEYLFLKKNCDLVIFWEDDDWYSNEYIETIVKNWISNNKPTVIGFGKTLYYHLFEKRYLIAEHPSRASACCTAVTKEILNIKFPIDSYPYVDKEIWRQLDNKQVLNFKKFYHVGFKHGIGLTGGGGHVKNWESYTNSDYDSIFLKSIIDNDSFIFYDSIKI
jgi:hypothetical protein